MIILGITGTLGAGKGTIVEYLKEKGFVHYSARDFITQTVKKRGLPTNRDTLTETANMLRKKYGPMYIIGELYKKARNEEKNAVIESVRAKGEVAFLKKQPNFYLIAIDADPEIRFERIQLRGGETDNVSFEKFLEDEKREMNNTDPTKQSIRDVMEEADFTIQNSTSIEDLAVRVDTILSKISEHERS